MKDFPFHSPIFLTLCYSFLLFVTCIKEGCKYVSGKRFFTTLNKTLKFKKKKNPRKMHFTAIYRLKFEKTSLRSPPRANPWSHWTKHTVKKLNLWGKTAVDRGAWIKAWILQKSVKIYTVAATVTSYDMRYVKNGTSFFKSIY